MPITSNISKFFFYPLTLKLNKSPQVFLIALIIFGLLLSTPVQYLQINVSAQVEEPHSNEITEIIFKNATIFDGTDFSVRLIMSQFGL